MMPSRAHADSCRRRGTKGAGSWMVATASDLRDFGAGETERRAAGDEERFGAEALILILMVVFSS